MGVREPVDKLFPAAGAQAPKCRLCSGDLSEAEDDDFEHNLCCSCKERPEARRLGLGLTPPPPRRPHVPSKASATAAREFTAAEQSLIGRVHAFMPAAQLLDLLNERLICDLGPDAARYTADQLQRQIAKIAPGRTATSSHDWASLRKLLTQARKSGTLARVSEQVINDFAVVFSLNPKQVMVLKDTLLASQETRS